jgi:hypothetical protein
VELKKRAQLTELEEPLDRTVHPGENEAPSTLQRRFAQRHYALEDDRVDVFGLAKVDDDAWSSRREGESVEQTSSIDEVELAFEVDDEEVGVERLLIRDDTMVVPYS